MTKKLKHIFAIFFFALLCVQNVYFGVPSAQAAFDPNAIVFGDNSNVRPAPTSGTLTGTYRTAGPWTTTGSIICNRCRLYFGSTVNIGHGISVTPGIEANKGGGAALTTSGNGSPGYSGSGLGAPISTPGIGGGPAVFSGHGAGGSHGGLGGQGSYTYTYPGSVYPLESLLAGSGGGGGGTSSSATPPAHGKPAGDGGGSIYIEAVGDINIASGGSITANGTAGVNDTDGAGGAGGGGSGGGIDVRSLGNINIASGASVTANGGAGGLDNISNPAAGGGAGGIVSLMPGPGKSTTNNGTVAASGGTGGNNGAAGVVDANATFTGPRAPN